MSYYNDCLKKFSRLPDEIRNKIGSEEILKIISEIEINYNIELKFLVILISIGEMEIKDTPTYLEKKFAISSEKSEEIKEKLTRNVFGLVVENRSKLMSIEEKIKEVFQNKLVETLNGDEEFKEVLNEELTLQFSGAGELTEQDVLKILLLNQERITHKKFLIDERPHSPSIANWLKDFIKVNGSEMFDNLVLSEYLINSQNAKKLDREEKNSLRNLLLLYRNVKFFPESMEDVPPEKWEIIPLSHTDNQKIRREDLKNVVPGKNREIDELRKMASEYPKGSLERKAIEEEIDRLKL